MHFGLFRVAVRSVGFDLPVDEICRERAYREPNPGAQRDHTAGWAQACCRVGRVGGESAASRSEARTKFQGFIEGGAGGKGKNRGKQNRLPNHFVSFGVFAEEQASWAGSWRAEETES